MIRVHTRPFRTFAGLGAILTVLAGLALAVRGVYAQTGETIRILSVPTTSCTPFSFIIIRMEVTAVKDQTYKIVRQVVNPIRGTAMAAEDYWMGGSGFTELSATVPAETEPGDILDLTVALTTPYGAAVWQSRIAYDCSTIPLIINGQILTGTPPDTGSAPNGTPGAEPVEFPPLSIEQMALTVPNADGVLACAAFPVDGWGPVSVDFTPRTVNVTFADFPSCAAYAPNITAACLTDTGTWTDSETHNVRPYPDGTGISFEVTQHGHCGLFPTVPVVAPLTATPAVTGTAPGG